MLQYFIFAFCVFSTKGLPVSEEPVPEPSAPENATLNKVSQFIGLVRNSETGELYVIDSKEDEPNSKEEVQDKQFSAEASAKESAEEPAEKPAEDPKKESAEEAPESDESGAGKARLSGDGESPELTGSREEPAKESEEESAEEPAEDVPVERVLVSAEGFAENFTATSAEESAPEEAASVAERFAELPEEHVEPAAPSVGPAAATKELYTPVYFPPKSQPFDLDDLDLDNVKVGPEEGEDPFGPKFAGPTF